MHGVCRRCQNVFALPASTPLPCPSCGSTDVATKSPHAQTSERAPAGLEPGVLGPRPAYSAPVSQPVSSPPPPGAATPPIAVATPEARPTLGMPPPAPAAALAPSAPPYLGPYGAPPPGHQLQPYPQPYAQQQLQPYGPHPYAPAPVNVVIQNQINPYPVGPYPYAMAPYARRKDAGVATLLSFFLPGGGQLYNGQIGKGLAFLLVSLFVNLPLMFVGVGFFTGLLTWIWSMVDAHSAAEKINRGELVV